MKRMLFVLFLFLAACNPIKQPNIMIKAEVSQLSEEEFSSVGTYGLGDVTKDDFRKFTFDFKLDRSTKFSPKVEFPKRISWTKAINSIE